MKAKGKYVPFFLRRKTLNDMIETAPERLLKSRRMYNVKKNPVLNDIKLQEEMETIEFDILNCDAPQCPKSNRINPTPQKVIKKNKNHDIFC